MSLEYQGAYMIVLYLGLSLGLSLQFAFLESDVFQLRKKSPFLVASFWVFCEWIRMFIVSGFTWNPLGLSLAWSHYPLFFASIAGVYGLSFWVIFTNLYALRYFLEKKQKDLFVWFFVLLLPYFFGYIHESYHAFSLEKAPKLSVALVQTDLKPEEKEPILKKGYFVSPLIQWERILGHLEEATESLDLIVLPEAALPFGADKTIYFHEAIKDLWRVHFGEKGIKNLPKLKAPFSRRDIDGYWYVSNGYIAKALAEQYQAEVIIGLESQNRVLKKFANAAFHFSPKKTLPGYYEKCILVPGAEYLPYSWLEVFAKRYGVFSQYKAGEKPGIFLGKVPMGISICYEETYGYLIRESRKLGAELFVNVTNDGWFPNTMLMQQHFDHGRIRGVENGVPIVRAANTGITASIDAFGRVQKALCPSFDAKKRVAKALFAKVPLYSYSTLYTIWGDSFILGIGFFIWSFFFLQFFQRKIGKATRKTACSKNGCSITS